VLRRLRVSLIQRATLVIDDRPEEALIVDLGLRGVFVERSEELPAGAPVTVRFRLPGNERALEARARVVWRHPADAPRVAARLPPGLGLEFTDMSDADRGRVRAFLVEHWRRAPRARQFTRAWPEGAE
jgi:Tfp pilus assembly protein PilZ